MERYLIIPSNKNNINKLELFLENFFNELKLKRDNFFHVLLSLNESVNNSISHGNNYDEDKSVIINCSWENSVLSLTVEDEGQGFDVSKIKDPTLPENIERERGRGLFLISKLADDFILKEKGRIIEIKFRIEREYQLF